MDGFNWMQRPEGREVLVEPDSPRAPCGVAWARSGQGVSPLNLQIFSLPLGLHLALFLASTSSLSHSPLCWAFPISAVHSWDGSRIKDEKNRKQNQRIVDLKGSQNKTPTFKVFKDRLQHLPQGGWYMRSHLPASLLSFLLVRLGKSIHNKKKIQTINSLVSL